MNKYPVATNELADGLATSGAALVAANNSIEEQVALLAAGNATMQDISAVSSGLKIVAARLRGTTSEADDDAESAVTNVSKLQEKIKDLTAEANGGEGIDIINEDGSYKSTWEILTEISKIFDKMDDMSQASLLELIAGKNRSSVVAAVLQNGEILEKAYTDALDSKGSAQEELDTYLNSIQGKIDKFTNTLQTMWMNTISSDTIKMFVDLGTAAIGAVDKIGMLPTVMMGVIGYFYLFKKISPIGIFKDLGSMISGYSSAIQQLNTLSKSSFDTQTITAYAQAVSGLSAKKQALALAGAGLNKQQIQEILTRNQVNKATIDQIMSEGELAAAKNLTTTAIVSEAVVLSAEEKAKLSETAQNWLAANSSKQLTLDLLQEAVAHDVLTKEAAEEIAVKNNLIATNTQAATTSASLWKTFSSMPLLGKIGLAVTAIGAIYTIGKKLYDYFNPSTEQLVQEWEEVKSEIENVNSELQATKSRIEELESKGVLSIVDKQELVQLRQTNDELERRLRLAKQNEASAANKAKRAVEKEYKEYVVTMSAGDVTEETMKQYNDSDIITRLLPTFQDNSSSLPALNGFDRFTEYQQGVIKSALSAEAFAELSTTPWVDVSDAIKEEVYSVVATHQQAMEDISYASVGGAKDVHIEEYIDEATKKIQELKSKIYNSNGQLKPGITDEYAIEIHDQIKEIESELIAASGELYEYMDQYGADSTDAFVRGLQDQIDKIDMVVNPIEFYAKKFDEILGRHSDEKKTLYELAEAGQLSADVLNNTTYAPLMSELNKLGITAQDVVDHITSLGEVELAKVTDPTFSIADYVTGIDDIQEKISSLQGALESLESGTFTYSDFIDLTQQFPELAKGVDTSSKSFNGLAKNLRKAIKAAPDELVDELKDLRKQLKENGRSTVEIDQLIDAMENLPVDAVKNLSDEYVTLSNKIKEAKTAQNELQEAMSENPNEGYETRGEAMEYMKDKMKRGEIGSESELWDVAEQYGFTYDSAKSINENADALAQFIAIREQWFAKNDDGEYTFAGTEDFINDVEKVVNSNAELQKILKWEYDENTGAFNFDFDNASWDQIIAYLSESKELAGLTSEEFHDMLVQIGQYFGLNWEDANDITKYIDEIYKSSADSTTKLEEMTSAIEPYVEKELKMDIDFDSLTYADIAALNCEESIKRLLGVYVENRDYLKSNPLQIKYNGDIETDIINPLKDAGLKVDEIIDEAGNKQFTIDVVDLETLMRNNGYTTENVMDVVNSIFGEGSDESKLVQLREDISNIKYITGGVLDTLDELGASYIFSASSQGAHIEIDSNIDELLRNLHFTDAEIARFKDEWAKNGIVIKTETDISGVEESQEALDKQPENVTTTVDLDTKPFHEKMKLVFDDLDELTRPRTATIVLNTVTRNVSIPSGAAAGAAVGTNVNGTAHAQGSWGAKESGTSLVGELGPELIVDPQTSSWHTVGENGAEFTQVKRGQIIFNHKQTEQLLKHGYVAGRGKLHGGNSAFASGTAFVDGGGTFAGYDFSGSGGYIKYDVNDEIVDSFGDLSGAADSISDAADEFREVFDWVEVRLEEINETLSLLESQLENAIYYTNKNQIIDEMIGVNKIKLENLEAGYKKYEDYAAHLLTKIPEDYQEAAKNGAIAIEEFVGEADEITLEAIQNYREWAQKAADLKQQANEVITAIRDLAIQKFDNAYEAGDVRATVEDSQTEKLQNQIDLLEEMGEIASAVYYGINGGDADSSTGMFENAYKKIEYLTEARDAMQKALDEAVEAGDIERGSNEWYELVNQMYEIDAQIHEATMEIEQFQNAINEIHWENFDQLISRIENLRGETQSLIDLMDSDDMVITPETEDGWNAEDVQWTKEGLASLGLYAQQMEMAEYQARQYAEAIDKLTADYEAGLYSENEYLEKLEELKNAQYDSIEAYEDAKEAIRDLNQARIDEIKKGIEKQIDAYSELIEKQKEALDSEKDLYDFQKSTAEQQKTIAEIERQLAALANDNSMSAIAKRKQLEAELAEAQYALQDTYYNRSVEDKQTALDQELESFQEEKEAEIEKWEEYMDNIEAIVAESLGVVQENAEAIGQTLTEKAEEYNLTVSDAILSPWEDGSIAVSDYQDRFDTAMSSTMDQLEALKSKWQEVIDKMVEASKVNMDAIDQENENYAAAEKQDPKKEDAAPKEENKETQKPSLATGSYVEVKPGTRWYADSYGGGSSGNARSGKIKYINNSGSHPYNIDGLGWIKKQDIKGYKHGTSGVEKDQFAIVDEDQLEELVLGVENGRLTYLSKGSSVIPADLTSNLMSWGALDPQDMLDRNRPTIMPSKHIVNTEIQLDCSVGTLVNIEHCDKNTLPDVERLVNKAFEKHMQNLNNSIKKFTR